MKLLNETTAKELVLSAVNVMGSNLKPEHLAYGLYMDGNDIKVKPNGRYQGTTYIERIESEINHLLISKELEDYYSTENRLARLLESHTLAVKAEQAKQERDNYSHDNKTNRNNIKMVKGYQVTSYTNQYNKGHIQLEFRLPAITLKLRCVTETLMQDLMAKLTQGDIDWKKALEDYFFKETVEDCKDCIVKHFGDGAFVVGEQFKGNTLRGREALFFKGEVLPK